MLADAILQSAATALSLPLPLIKSFHEVESRAEGFLPDGRPVVLFERHVMYRRVVLKLGRTQADEWARYYPTLIHPSPTPAGSYGSMAHQPDRMGKAAELDRDCALESASWGLYQIMGYHWKRLGYPTLQSFINAMYRSEADQLDAFVRFVLADPQLHDAMTRRDFVAMATIYNGPRQSGYDRRLREAFIHHGGEVA